jgi:hypothetical protein
MHPVLRTVLALPAVIAARPASAAEPNPLRLPDGSALERVDFDRLVASLFGRLGCNARSCHGSFQVLKLRFLNLAPKGQRHASPGHRPGNRIAC